ncbi:unnamed protein product [Linum trigynum]|uniref:Uncharacterized protein n=1 Tax=Linum trigynum TaxID=586398 RepID=A0AAV2DCM3_9ROSI
MLLDSHLFNTVRTRVFDAYIKGTGYFYLYSYGDSLRAPQLLTTTNREVSLEGPWCYCYGYCSKEKR